MAENIAEVLQENKTLRDKLKETSNKVSEADEVCILWAVLEVLCVLSVMAILLATDWLADQTLPCVLCQ